MKRFILLVDEVHIPKIDQMQNWLEDCLEEVKTRRFQSRQMLAILKGANGLKSNGAETRNLFLPVP